MALSKGLRLLWKQEPGPSALLEARSRRDCLLLEAGTVAALTPEEKDAIKGQYEKLMDAYGCLGELQLKCDGWQQDELYSVSELYPSQDFAAKEDLAVANTF